MKLTFVLMTAAFLQVSARSSSQTVTYSAKNTKLETVFNAVEKQTGYVFFYNDADVGIAKPVTIDLNNTPVQEALKQILSDQPFTYSMVGKTIVISKKPVVETALAITSMATIPPPAVDVSGIVTDEKGAPLSGASVVIKGTDKGAVTDESGRFVIRGATVNSKTILVVTYIGYESQEFALGGQTSMSIKLQPENKMNEAVVIGYGVVRKRDLTGSVAVIKSKDLDAGINTNLGSALEGKIPGVNIMANSGQPGSPVSVRVRGLGTINNRDPLIIVDDVPVVSTDLQETTGNGPIVVKHDPLSGLNPSDIESVQVLKDASAAAIYGSRAANGVILITTKSGKKGPLKLDANIDYGVSQIGKKLTLLTADQWLSVMNMTYKNNMAARPNIVVNPEVTGKGTDWQDALFQRGDVKNVTLGANGGGDHLNYSFSTGYLNQKGTIIGTDYERFNVRLKSDFTKGRVRIGQTVSVVKEKYDEAPPYDFARYNLIPNMLGMAPVYRLKEPDGSWGGNDIQTQSASPLDFLDKMKYKTDWYRMLAVAYAEVSLLDGLKFKSSVSGNGDIGNTRITRKKGGLTSGFVNNYNNARYIDRNTTLWQVENTLSYNKVFGKVHSINAVVGQTALKNHYTQTVAYKEGMPDGIWSLNAGSLNQFVSGYERTNTLASYLGRLIYSYDNRYIFTGTIRRDGSSRFGKDNAWGNFPSLSVAWNVANEDFFKSIKSKVSDLKIRASWGKLGNQEIGDYVYIPVINAGTNYATGDILWPGSIQNNAVNPDLKWEATTTKNIGLDLSLFNSRLTYNFDYYNKITSDMLMTMPIPFSSGFSGSPTINAGEVSNKGFEMILSYQGDLNKFHYGITGTLSHNKNEVVKLNRDMDIFSYDNNGMVSLIKPGFPMYGFWSIPLAGIFRSQSEIDSYVDKNGKKIQPNAVVGDQKFVDVNGDGKISRTITGGDLVYMGNPFPDFEYGVRLEGSWKSFDASVYCQGTHGNTIYNRTKANSPEILDSYSFNPNGHLPRLGLTDPNNNGLFGLSRNLEDGSYFRMKTVQLGFTMPSAMTNRIGVSRCRFYIAADNLLTVTKYTGYNPEVGGNGGNMTGRDDNVYPYSKNYHIGAQLNF